MTRLCIRYHRNDVIKIYKDVYVQISNGIFTTNMYYMGNVLHPYNLGFVQSPV